MKIKLKEENSNLSLSATLHFSPFRDALISGFRRFQLIQMLIVKNK